MEYYFLQINHYMRGLIYKWAEQIGNTIDKNDVEYDEKVLSLLTSKIYQLKKVDYLLFKNIIGLVFADTYRNFSYIDNYLELGDDIEIWEKYNNLNGIDDLVNKIDDGQISLQLLVENSIAFDLKDDYEQALCYHVTDNDFLIKFNPYLLFEQDELFKQYTLKELVDDYIELITPLDENISEEDEETTTNINNDIENFISFVINFIAIQSVYDFAYFKKIMLEMINTYYRIIKIYLVYDKKAVDTIDFDIIKLIEEHAIDDVIEDILHDNDKMGIIIDEYFAYESGQCQFDDVEIEHCFEENTEEKVKRKLLNGEGNENYKH